MSTSNLPEGKAQTIKTTFSRTTAVNISIQASADTIWRLLTEAEGYPRWNSTVISIDGKIAEGNKIQLKSTLDPKRTFKLKVKDWQPPKRLAWGDGMGTRVYALTPQGNGWTGFSMEEKIGGPLFPLFARMIPSFDESFEQFAADLKKEAERQ